jgi:two-component system copper resistance phosphate regulon response regulator CusR
MRTLLVDDDPAFRKLASMALGEAGVESTAVATSREALAFLDRRDARAIELLLLDVELPEIDGMELLRRLRKLGHDLPIVLVTVHDRVAERIRALQEGADDYVVKPFHFPELVARLRAVVRRCRGAEPIRVGAFEIQPAVRRVVRDGEPIHLTRREFDVLYVLTQAQDRIVSRKELLQRVWRMSFEPGTNFIQVHVSKLRAKLGTLDGFRIDTIRGQGYRLASCPLEPIPVDPTEPGAAPTP